MRDVKFRFVNRIMDTGKIKFVYTSVNELEYGDSRQDKVNYQRVGINLFTGLLDKSGKKIYEEDIVKHRNGISAVSWNQKLGAWNMNISSNVNDQEAGGYFGEDIIVLGNIFENPELLKV